jgi:hypothetical protein
MDFELSESKVLPPAHKKASAVENLMRRKMNELDDSGDLLDSQDF